MFLYQLLTKDRQVGERVNGDMGEGEGRKEDGKGKRREGGGREERKQRGCKSEREGVWEKEI